MKSSNHLLSPFLLNIYFTYPMREIHVPLTLPGERLQRPQQEQQHPFPTVCAVFLCVQTKVWLPMLGIFNVRADVKACDCTRGLYGHRKRVCTEIDSGRKIPCLTGESNQPQRRAGSTFYQLSLSSSSVVIFIVFVFFIFAIIIEIIV